MKKIHDIDNALAASRSDVDELLSTSEITNLINSTPIPSNPTFNPAATSSNYSTMVTIGGLAVATTAAVIFMTMSADPSDESQVVIHKSAPQFSQAPAEDRLAENTQQSSPLPLADHDSDNEDAHDKQAPPSGAIETLHGNSRLYVKLGLTVTPNSVRTIDGNKAIEARSTGIGVPHDQSSISSTTRYPAPVMIVIYHDSEHYASYWDKSDNEYERRVRTNPYAKLEIAKEINELIGVAVPLSNSGTLAGKVVAVLWYNAKDIEAVDNKLLTEVYGSNAHHDQSAFATVQLSPNPLQTTVAPTLTVTFMKDAVSSAHVYDMFGNLITTLWTKQSMPMGKSYVDIQGLDHVASGMYSVVVEADGASRVTSRLMIQR